MVVEAPDDVGRQLVEKAIIDADQLESARQERERSGASWGTVLLRVNPTSTVLLKELAEAHQIEFTHLSGRDISADVLKILPTKFAFHYRCVPLAYEDDVLTVAMVDPFDTDSVEDLARLLGKRIKTCLAPESEVDETLKVYYGLGAETLQRIEEGQVRELSPTTLAAAQDIGDLAGEAAIVRFVNQIILQAFHDRATDIHIEPFPGKLRVRFRIDGVLHIVNTPPQIYKFHQAIVSRIKIMAGMNIAERRLPQDGRIKVKIGGEEFDLRISILPGTYGETINIRLLSSSDILYGLGKLGLADDDLDKIEDVISRPYGIIMVTGPTGSGKTTTLYACLNRLNRPDKKIITIEDPVEYMLDGITQIQVHPKINLRFSTGLRSMLRHDPDIMMVGEIRDFETAEITIQTALTGHLVFSTVHTNQAAGTITRLVNMGIEPYLIASSVECIIAQRLVRLICRECRRSYKAGEDVIRAMNLDESHLGTEIYRGTGCPVCRQTGYFGRTAIYEIMMIDEDIREAIMQTLPAKELEKLAKQKGMKTLRVDGWNKAVAGLTTVEEVLRVTQKT